MSEKFSSSRILQNIVEQHFDEPQLPSISRNSYVAHLSDNSISHHENQQLIDSNNVVQMVIELDQTNSVTLTIGQHDDPFTLAKKFCYSYNIDPKVINTLGNSIKNIQKTQFRHNQDYSQLIRNKQQNPYWQINKQNNGHMSNLKTTDSGLKRSKATKSSHNKHNTTFNNHDTTFDNYHNSNSQVNLSKTSVFERLYHDSRYKYKKRQLQNSKQESRLSKSISRDLSVSNCAAQLRIYEKNTKLKQQTLKRNQTIKAYLDSLNDHSLTHTPQINPVSKLIAEKLQQFNEHPRDKSRQKSIRRTLEYLKQKQLKSLEQCTFKPKILIKNPKRQQKISDRFILLHQDHYMREDKLQTLKQSQIQKQKQQKNPVINQISRKIIGDKNFNKRMVQYKAISQQKKRRIIAESRSNQKFRPQINKPKTTTNRSNQLSENSFMRSCERLYNHSKSKQKKVKKQKSIKFTNKISEKIYQENKRNAFRYIFTLMDNDQDGLISSLKINILGLGTQILNLLAPLLCEMQDVGVELDEEQFVDSIERLFKTFTVLQKNLILNIYKNPLRKEKGQEEPSFHPSLNERSLQIARQSRQSCSSLYQIGRQKQHEKQQKLAKLRQLKTMLQFQQCTFQPNLFYHHI